MYRYYMTERGFSPGAQPMKNLIDHGDYDGRVEVEPGVKAYSWVEYSEPLTDQEVAAYELVPVDPLPFN